MHRPFLCRGSCPVCHARLGVAGLRVAGFYSHLVLRSTFLATGRLAVGPQAVLRPRWLVGQCLHWPYRWSLGRRLHLVQSLA